MNSAAVSIPKIKKTALVVQASEMDCQLLANAIERQCRLRVVSCLVNSADVLAAVQQNAPDLVLISVRLQDGAYAGLKAAKNLQKSNVTSSILMLLDSEDRELVVESFRCGAMGVFTRTGSSRQLCECITAVLQGRLWANNTQMKWVVEALAQTRAPVLVSSKSLRSLTKREDEVVRLLAAGSSNREIGERLNLNENTVKNYVSSIFQKLGVSSRIELVLYFFFEQGHTSAGDADISVRNFGT
jgi:two-component system, NarL family, nitrate/nitrite response regulator NarL